MKPGDLVVYNRKKVAASVPPSDFERLGVVVKVSFHQLGELCAGSPQTGLPMALVVWNGIAGSLKHRQDMLEVISENR